MAQMDFSLVNIRVSVEKSRETKPQERKQSWITN